MLGAGTFFVIAREHKMEFRHLNLATNSVVCRAALWCICIMRADRLSVTLSCIALNKIVLVKSTFSITNTLTMRVRTKGRTSAENNRNPGRPTGMALVQARSRWPSCNITKIDRLFRA